MTKPNWLDEACKRPPTTAEQVVIERLAKQEAERQRDEIERDLAEARRLLTIERECSEHAVTRGVELECDLAAVRAEVDEARERLESIVEVLENKGMNATAATMTALFLAREPLSVCAVEAPRTEPVVAPAVAPEEPTMRGSAQKNDVVKIPNGDFYDCGDGEELQYTEPEEALEAWIDGWCTRDCDVSAVIREHSPVKLLVFRRDEVDDVDLTAWAQGAADDAQQAFDDEYGDPEGGTDNGLDDGAVGEYRTAVRAALVRFIAHGTVWRCTKIMSVNLDAEQVETILREYRPDWWDDDEEDQ